MQAHGTTPASPLLQVRDLQVRFGTKSVVRGAGFEIARGEKLALVGESGSGKTITALSLLRLLGDAAVEGQALFAGRDLLQLSEREMRGVRGGDIAMVFQEPTGGGQDIDALEAYFRTHSPVAPSSSARIQRIDIQ